MENKILYRSLKATIEGLLEDYPNYYKHSKEREFELRNPVGQIDDNVGGGKAQNNWSNPVDRMMITTASDSRLADLTWCHRNIQVCFEEADEDIQTICKELYFKKPELRKYRTIGELINAHKITMSKAVAYRKWNDFIMDCIKQTGLDRYLG